MTGKKASKSSASLQTDTSRFLHALEQTKVANECVEKGQTVSAAFAYINVLEMVGQELVTQLDLPNGKGDQHRYRQFVSGCLILSSVICLLSDEVRAKIDFSTIKFVKKEGPRSPKPDAPKFFGWTAEGNDTWMVGFSGFASNYFFTDYAPDPDPANQAGRRTLNIAFMFASQAATGLFENIRKSLKHQDNKCTFVTPTAVEPDIASLVPNTSNIFPAWTEAVSILWSGIHFNEAVDYLIGNLTAFLHAFENPLADKTY